MAEDRTVNLKIKEFIASLVHEQDSHWKQRKLCAQRRKTSAKPGYNDVVFNVFTRS